MREITFAEALNEGLREEMERDNTVFIAGEEVGFTGGIYGVTKGLMAKFGRERVRDTPISETAIIGLANGAAAAGLRPLVEIMYQDFMAVCMDQIVNQGAKMTYMFGGQVKLPLVIRTQCGVGRQQGAQHSQSLEAWFAHIPGLKVVMPSTPYDAKGLIKTAIRDNNPVIFIEHKMLYRLKGSVPEREYVIPLGQADVKQAGDAVSIVATSWMVHKALAAAAELAQSGIACEVIDLRTVSPWDKRTVLESVRKTGRLVIVHEAVRTGGFGGEVAATVAEEAFAALKAPIRRVTAPDIPVPFSPRLEEYFIPEAKDIIAAVKDVLGYQRA
ncbi:MAG: alpha-ketoacid dehydrogenase subunit beta [bacterium]|jgi:pyruvate/2-oxoglutarate/acetoin dehydrogenase E1 component